MLHFKKNKKVVKLIKVYTLLLSAFLCGCNDFSIKDALVYDSKIKFRKVNVLIETPQGVFSGFSINAYRTKCGPTFSGNKCAIYQSSEAVSVDLPNGKTVYALLSRNGDKEWLFTAPQRAMYKDPNNIEKRYFKTGWFPDFVYFEDKRFPNTVKFIDKDKYFFDNYKIKEVSIEPHKGPKTHIISKDIPWINYIIGSFSGEPSYSLISPIDADRIIGSDFINEDKGRF
jgi:hypothetical protein